MKFKNIKIRGFCPVKYTDRAIGRQAKIWQKIFAEDVSYRGLLF